MMTHNDSFPDDVSVKSPSAGLNPYKDLFTKSYQAILFATSAPIKSRFLAGFLVKN